MPDVKSSIIKRSILLENQRTSVSLEDGFWDALRHIAAERRETVPELVASISANRQSSNLSSAIRLYVLWYYKDKAARDLLSSKEQEIGGSVAPP
jgi:predicted DNA-binding ribbon-helix-helix protein